MITAGIIKKIRAAKGILSSVWFLGLIIAIPVILLMPGLFNKYKATLVLQESAAFRYYRIFFRDLDGNGIKQKIYAFPNSSNQLSFQYFGDNGRIINYINFRHKYAPYLFYLYFSDINRNGKPEVYGFTLGNDSLFLNWKELTEPFSNTSESRFISRLGTFNNGDINVTVNRFTTIDIDNDGDNEIVFSVVSGFSKFPRMVVVYHPETGELHTSKDMGINPYFMQFYDLDLDGKQEIITGSAAGYNLSDTAYTQVIDSRPYLLAYNSELNMFFPPVPFSSGIYNSIQFFVNSRGRKEIAVFQFNRSRATEKMIGIYKVDFNGNLKDSLFLPEYGKRFAFQVVRVNDDFWLYTGDKIVMMDDMFKVYKVKKIDISTVLYRNPASVVGYPEFATVDHSSTKTCIYTEDFDFNVEKKYSDEKIKNIILDIGKGADYFMVQTDNNEYTYHFQKNGLYYLKFPIYIVIYLLSVLFVWLIQHTRERQLKAKFEMQTQLRNMEVRYLRMQMDPHFMLNAFNSMALLLKNGAKEEALDAFMKFTQMVRSNFDFSDRFTKPLSEELQMVRNFLDINKIRFKEKLDCSIRVAEDVPMDMLIPKMTIQIHVENALKHGLVKLERSGKLSIDIVREKEEILVTIEDNGIGRQKAAQGSRDSTKQGLRMLQAMYDRLNQQNKANIVQYFTDLTDEAGNPAGTRVELRIPVNLKEDQGTGLS
jgi:hypothetical protein